MTGERLNVQTKQIQLEDDYRLQKAKRCLSETSMAALSETSMAAMAHFYT